MTLRSCVFLDLDVEDLLDDVDDRIDRQRHGQLALGDDHERLQPLAPDLRRRRRGRSASGGCGIAAACGRR